MKWLLVLLFHCFALLCTCHLVQSQELPSHLKPLVKSPANGKPTPGIEVDLDGDGKPDIARWAFLKEEENQNFRTYRLWMYLTKVDKVYETVLSVNVDISSYPIPITVRRNVLSVMFYQDGTAHYGRTLKLRWDENLQEMMVIGYDLEYKPSMTEAIAKSYNLLTGQTEIKYFEDISDTAQAVITKLSRSKTSLSIGDVNPETLFELDAVFDQ